MTPLLTRISSFALQGVSMKVVAQALSYREHMVERAKMRATIETGKTMDANRDALLKAVK